MCPGAHPLTGHRGSVRPRTILVYEERRMRFRCTSMIAVLAAILLGSLMLSGCPARRSSGSPADLDPTFLDRA